MSDQHSTIHGMFEQQVQRTPGAVAITTEGRNLSYAQLNGMANALARELRSHGVGPGRIVMIIPRRCEGMLAGILAVLKAGGAYLPIDPRYPTSRATEILEDHRIEHVLHQRSDAGKIPAAQYLYDLDSNWNHKHETTDLVPLNTPDDPAYVIFTSGSTGKPKGVVVTHSNVVNLIHDLSHRLQIDQSRRMLALTTVSFDIFVVETLLPLTCGARVVIAHENEQLDVALTAALIQRERIDFVQMTPSRLKSWLQLLPERESLQGVRDLVFGGEALPEYLLEQLAGLPCRIHNLYGPTEVTVYCTGTIVHPGHPVTIGHAIAGNNAYIVDEDDRLLAAGTVGELLIGGPGVAHGYLHSPELTAERFVDGLFNKSERVYRTGDLARKLPDGRIEFLGRSDRQVKLRGFRIEPAEIEKCLASRAGIRDVVVEPFQDSDDGPFLCAYYVSDEELDDRVLRRELSAQLPDYMVPACFIHLLSLPLTVNNKLDRQALPRPAYTRRRDCVAPRSPLEKQLLELWSDQLRIDAEQFGIDDHFLDLGGHSLKASLLVAQIHRTLQVRISMIDFFQNATIRLLARKIECAPITPPVTIPRVEDREHYPLAPQQRGLYFLELLGDGSTAYNLPDAFFIDGPCDTNLLESVLQRLIDRHECFRTSFTIVDGVPVQTIHEHVSFQLEFVEQRHEGPDAEVAAFVRPFDLSEPALLRARIVRFHSTRYLLLLDMHHIIADGFSRDVFISDFNMLCRGNPLPPLNVRFRDYVVARAAWEETAEYEQSRLFWISRFQEPVEPLRLPADNPRPACPRFRGGQLEISFDKPIFDPFQSLIREENTSLFIGLLGVTSAFLSNVTGQSDIVVGTPVAGRGHAELARLIGMFVNTLAIRTRVDPHRSFRQLLQSLHVSVMEALDHQEYPFDQLVNDLHVKREPGRNPLFDVLFVFQDSETEPLSIPGAEVSQHAWQPESSKVDLTICLREDSHDLHCCFQYDTDLFRRETVERLLAEFSALFHGLLSEPNAPLIR